MRLSETTDWDQIAEVFQVPEVREELRLPADWDVRVLDLPGSVFLRFHMNDGRLAGLIWFDEQAEGVVGHVAFTKLCRGRRAVKAIWAAANYAFLTRDWTAIWTKAPFAKSHLLVRLLGWEDVRVEESDWGPPWGVMKKRIAVLTREKWLQRSAFPPYFVTGYPRSGTAWIANLLTSGGGYCLHEGTLLGAALDAWLCGAPHRGTSDSSILLTSKLVQANPDAKVIWVQRNKEQARQAFLKWLYAGPLSKQIPPDQFQRLFDQLDEAQEQHLRLRSNVLVVPFRELFLPETAEKIWRYVYPTLEYDKVRGKMLCGLNVQQAPTWMLKLRPEHNPILPEVDLSDPPPLAEF